MSIQVEQTSKSKAFTLSTTELLYIVCPVHYEQDNIKILCEKIIHSIALPFHILFIYDDPKDPTVAILEKIKTQNNDPHANISLLYNSRGGVIEALKLGLSVPPLNVPVVVIMADLCDDLAIVPQMIAEWKKGAVIVGGSRYIPGGKEIGAPLLKRTLSKIASKSLYWLRKSPVQDVTNNFKLYNTHFLRDQTIESTGGFELAMELTAKALFQKKKIVEIPVTWTGRVNGKSKFKFMKWLPHYLRWYIYILFH
ncbi:MAG: glycosyltransferase [Deltaproteobacteria bacterium]|nr:glycosyltransferase [Deltaproteobacteria bacterium]